jgi:hypothetical protein
MLLAIYENYIKFINDFPKEKNGIIKLFKIDEEEQNDLFSLIKIIFKHQIINIEKRNIYFEKTFDINQFIIFLLEQSEQNIFNIEELNIETYDTQQSCYFLFLLINYNETYMEFGKSEILNYNEIEFLNNNFELNKSKSFLIKIDNDNCKDLFDSMLMDVPFKKKNNSSENTEIYYLKDGELISKVYNLFRLKVEIVSKFKSILKIDLKTKQIREFSFDKTKLNSNEVCDYLGITTQLLAYWRRTNKIKYEKVNGRLFLYDKKEVEKISQIRDLINIEQNFNSNSKEKTKKMKKTYNKENEKDNLQKLYKLIDIWSYRIQENKKINFYFPNLSNLIPNSSPLVMINNKGEIEDYITKKIYYKANETYKFLKSKQDKGLEPIIDKSDKKYKGYEKFYFDEVKKCLK